MNNKTPEAIGAHPVEANVRQLLATTLIRSGRLPAVISGSVYAGHGAGERCALCDAQVTPEQVGYELVMAEGASSSQATYMLHLPCFEAWALACREDRE